MSDSQSLSIFADQGLSAEQATFCDLIADGNPIYRALAAMHWTRDKYRYWCAQLPAFAQAVERARAIAQHEFVDQIPDIIANEPDLVRMRERVSAIKWTASKLSPRVYGDKLDITVEQRVDLTGALAEARARTLRPMCDSVPMIEGEFEALPNVAATRSVDDESTAPASTPSMPDIFS